MANTGNNTVLPGTDESYASDAVKDADGVEINFQKIKPVHGEDGEEPKSVSEGDPLPTRDKLLLSGVDGMLIYLKIIATILCEQQGESLNSLLNDMEHE